MKAEKKPDVTARKLVKRGYKYKMSELTKEQKKEQREGVKEYDTRIKQTVTYDPPDYNYYYKKIDDATIKIFKVGDRFYYKNNWVQYMSRLPLVEEDARVEHQYADLQARVVDTKPLVSDTVVAEEPIFLLPGWEVITLEGGPAQLNGKQFAWKLDYPVFMRQYEDPNGKVRSARYQRNMNIVEIDGIKSRINERVNVYNFKDIIG